MIIKIKAGILTNTKKLSIIINSINSIKDRNSKTLSIKITILKLDLEIPYTQKDAPKIASILFIIKLIIKNFDIIINPPTLTKIFHYL